MNLLKKKEKKMVIFVKYIFLALITVILFLNLKINETNFDFTESNGLVLLRKIRATKNLPMERVIVKLKPAHNMVTADTTNGPKKVNVVLLEPLKGLDFRKDTLLYFTVIKDMDTIINRPISSFINKKQRRKIKRAFINQSYNNFVKLSIGVYDKSEKKRDFDIQAVLFVGT